MLLKQGLMDKDKLEFYKDKLEAKNDILEDIKKIYDKLIETKYVLADINTEIVFALGFIMDKSILDDTKYLRKLLKYRTRLYWDMLAELPEDLQREFKIDRTKIQDITSLEEDAKLNLDIDVDMFLYKNLYKLIRLYRNHSDDGLYLNQSTYFKTYLLRMQRIARETYILFPDILPKDYSNMELFLDLMEIKDIDLANLFGMSKSEFSKFKNQGKLNGIWANKLRIFFETISEYLDNKTTISSLGSTKKTAIMFFDEWNVNSILEQFSSRYEEERHLQRSTVIKKNYFYLIQHLNLLEHNLVNLNKEDFEAIERLLRLKLKK